MRSSCLTLVIVLVFGSVSSSVADEAMLKKAKSLQASLISQKEKELKPAEATLKKRVRGKTRQQTRKQKTQVERLKSELEVLRDGVLQWPLLNLRTLSVGKIGVLDGGSAGFEILQIVNPNEMHVRRLGREYYDSRMILRGEPTTGLVTGKKNIHFEKGYEVTGTETYGTTTGATNTVFVVEPVDAKLLSILSEQAVLTCEEGDIRTWKTLDGKHSIRGSIVSAFVEIKREDGKVITVKLNKLSDADRQYVSERR